MVFKLIKNGYYRKKLSVSKKITGSIIVMTLLGLSIGKAMVGNVNQDGAVFIIAFGLIMFALKFLKDTHNLIKYYFIRL